jgi:uncharacterized protein (UPF0335 family)
MSLGQNTVSSEMLRSYVERIERLRADKKNITEGEAAVCAEAKANGFTVPAIKAVVKIRAMKPHDRQEAEALLDMYLHALGMASEPPLFRFAGLAGIDTTARDQIIDRMKMFVPASGLGEITVTMGGKIVRLTRDKEGEVVLTEHVDAPKPPATDRGDGWRSTAAKPDVPIVDAEGAHQLGRQYAKDNRPVIDNPFPFGDPRRARFDEGWRAGAGSDGMGPDRD